MLGNFATGISILAPAAMLTTLADGLHVGIGAVGLLMTFGAVILCIGSPLMALLTTTLDRRLLLVTTLAVLAVGQAATALAPDYATVLALRLVMLAVAAVFTPQAASTVAMIVPVEQRSGAISFVFLGWSLAVAGGMPMLTLLAAHGGWQVAYGVAALASLLPCVLLALTLPARLRGVPLSLGSFGTIARHRRIVLLLLITLLSTSGQFTVFIYLAPLAHSFIGADANVIGLIFAAYGIAGFIGNVIASRIVGRLGGFATAAIFLGSVLLGMVLWAVGAGLFAMMLAGAIVWGLGFAAINSIQQARLVAAAPPLASATVALNTSVLYVGQAIGSGLGGVMFARGYLDTLDYIGVGFVVLAFLAWALTREPAAPR
ncbi:MAG: MFS transporter [Rhodopseudomonas sp.]|nr:MFS transporter [Rhodopseudomonas sp.]